MRYPLIFGKTFPLIKGLVRDPNAGQILEQFRQIQEVQNSKTNVIPVPRIRKEEGKVGRSSSPGTMGDWGAGSIGRWEEGGVSKEGKRHPAS